MILLNFILTKSSYKTISHRNTQLIITVMEFINHQLPTYMLAITKPTTEYNSNSTLQIDIFH